MIDANCTNSGQLKAPHYCPLKVKLITFFNLSNNFKTTEFSSNEMHI